MTERRTSTKIQPLQRIIANAGWLTGSQFVGDLGNLVLFVVLARTYGPAGIGQYAYALGIAGLMYAAVNLGFEDLAVRDCARTTPVARRALIGRLLFIQIMALAVASVLLLVFLSNVDHSTQGIAVILVLVVQQAFFAFSRTLLSPAFAEQKMIRPAVAGTTTRLFGIGTSLALILLFDLGLAPTLIPLAGGGLLLLLYSIRSCMSECTGLTLSPQWLAIKADLIKAWPFAGSLFLTYLALRSSFIILNLMLGDSATGVYASGIKLMEAAVLPLGFLGFAAYPRLSSLYHHARDEFMNAGENLVRIAAVVGVVISWMLLYIAPYIIVPLLGKRFEGSAPVVQSLAGLGLLTSLSFILVRLLLASDKHHMRLLIQAIMVAVLLLTTVMAVPFFGLYGAIIGMYASVVASVILTTAALGMNFLLRLRMTFAKLGVAIFLAFLLGLTTEVLSDSRTWTALVSIGVFLVATFWFGIVPKHPKQALQTSGSHDADAKKF